MKSIKSLVILTLAVALLSSCDGKAPFVKRSVLEQSEQANAELKSSIKNLQDSYAKQNEDLCSILNDLSVISKRTTQIQLGAENPAEQINQVELIHSDIDAIKLRIDQLEKEAARARKLDKKLAVATKTIKELRATIQIQEDRIAELNASIAKKDATIKTQQDAITTKDGKIASQQEEIQLNVAKQKEMIYNAGVKLEEIADNGDFKITGRKNKNTLTDYRKSIYETAATYYEMAVAQGNAAAQAKLDSIKAKMANLK